MYRRFRIGSYLLASLILPVAWADDEDTRFLRDQTRRSTEQKTSVEQAVAPPPGSLRYEGQDYLVPDQLEALEPAIYIAINSKQWGQLPDFIGRYRLLEQHRPALVAMAQSLLAHAVGDYPRALLHMQEASEQEPHDVRIALEQARLWFEDHQDTRASAGFAQVFAAGLPPHAQHLVQQYRQALDQRAAWQGSAALAWAYNDNINQGNGHYSCLQQLAELCLLNRQMPIAHGSNAINYEWAVQRRFNLSGNHNVFVRPMTYGNEYARSKLAGSASIKDYSSNLALLQLGYQYLNARDSLSLLPYIEYAYRDQHRDYLARGLQLEWRHGLNRQWQLGASMDAKRLEYTDHGRKTGANHRQYQLGLLTVYSPSQQSNLYGGIDFGRKQYGLGQASSRDWAVRGGIYHGFAGSAEGFINAMAVYRQSRNDAFDGFLGARRQDRQQVYILRAGAKAWSIASLQPELRLRHSINRSNLDWAFGFKQTEFGLVLRRDI